ncbi:Pentatricopeptide repeat-containing protein [Dissostichus eleginoides]|uniref:Pentatricopeptide repeat-containing protein n=1 Tax=Dissostichus eleginoides TaxID=100907 RepID=A0AAD9F5J1_DISEL|nr:Pentatricopeptide repeat-containing protein [Dissostichus eleginoides]
MQVTQQVEQQANQIKRGNEIHKYKLDEQARTPGSKEPKKPWNQREKYLRILVLLHPMIRTKKRMCDWQPHYSEASSADEGKKRQI